MHGVLFTLIVIMFVLIVLAMIIRRVQMYDGYFEDEEVTTTVTTTVTEHPQEAFHIKGNLPVNIDVETKQRYVLDPADSSKMYLSAGDDLYEDANGEIWRLMD